MVSSTAMLRRTPGGSADLVAVARSLLVGAPGVCSVRAGGTWCSVVPVGVDLPDQGWKLHVSATPVSAAGVLERVVPVLARRRVAFKFAVSTGLVSWLTGRECTRAESGKFLTVYPVDDSQSVEVAAELHAVTDGLAGPRVLSDRAFCPGSLVHYRFGGYAGHARYDNDGVRQFVITGPDGSVVQDRRDAWFSPPPWVECPFEAADRSAGTGAPGPTGTRRGGAGTRSRGSAAVLLGGRFRVATALRHSAKGGVYLATDLDTGSEVVIKQGRAHAESDSRGRDAREALQNEAAMLTRLAALRVAPRQLGVFEQDGDLFLVQERLPGQTLRQWVRGAGHPSGSDGTAVAGLVRRLGGLLEAVHEAGVVLRDFSPTNVLVGDSGAVFVVDLELAAEIGAVSRAGGTPGYQAPELAAAAELAASPAEDLFSLGALTFLVATGTEPLLPSDDPPARGTAARLAALMDRSSVVNPAASWLAPIIPALMAERAEDRCGLHELSHLADEWRSGSEPRIGTVDRPAAAGTSQVARMLVPAPVDRVLSDGLEQLLGTAEPDAPRVWATTAAGATTDPGNVQHGTSGVLAVLLQAVLRRDDPAKAARLIRRVAHTLAGTRGADAGGRFLPGLYFGRAGPAWALGEAGCVLADAELVDAAVRLAMRLPGEWSNPDLTHGLAGAGLAHLRLWSLTKDARLLERTVAYAHRLASRAQPGPAGPMWPIPDGFDSRLAGSSHYGFAHGSAGIGYFLLAAGRAAGEQGMLELASEVGAGLCAVAELTDQDGRVQARGGEGGGEGGDVDDCGALAWWTVGPSDPTRLPHWCSGASGIGTFLLRLHLVTGSQTAGEYAVAAARTAYRQRWWSSTATCHGLAGDGQLLLDVADLLAVDRFRVMAQDLAEVLVARHCRRGGRLLVADETSRAVTLDYQTGLAGVVAYLYRLRYGGPRLWMVDDVLGLDAPSLGLDVPSLGLDSPSLGRGSPC